VFRGEILADGSGSIGTNSITVKVDVFKSDLSINISTSYSDSYQYR
jgi:hypothetical protein